MKRMNPALTNIDYLPIEENLPSVIKGKDIVIVGLQPWYFETGCNCKDIALLLSKYNRVLYVNFPIKRKAFFERVPNRKIEKHIRIIKEKQEAIRPINSNLWEFYPSTLIESANGLPSTRAFKLVNYLNNRRFARDIKKAMSALGFRDVIVFNDNDVYNGFYLKELLSPSLYIYYFRDFLQGYAYWKKHTSVLEPQLLRKSDVVVANSQYYTEYSLGFNANSFYIGQGCNTALFDVHQAYTEPEDMKEISGPRIGYIGALDASRLDTKIIELIAKERPQWNIVLVGPADEVFAQSALHQIPNVHFLGGKKMALLPSYVAAFDVCINPQYQNEITRGNYPLKIDEYLAMGKPTVATRTAAMKIFEAHTYLADTPEEYPALIERALAEDTVEKQHERIGFAHSHTWESSVHDLYKAILVTTEKTKLQ
jgi:glycosyltransferase involved in cell wall biosynthesis